MSVTGTMLTGQPTGTVAYKGMTPFLFDDDRLVESFMNVEEGLTIVNSVGDTVLVEWFFGPPVIGIEYEMDLRGVVTDWVV